MKPVSSRIEVEGFGLDRNVATRLLEEAGLKADKKTLGALVSHAKDSTPKNNYLNAKELSAALTRLVQDRRPNVKADQPIQRVIDAPPQSLSRYAMSLADTDGNKSKDMLTFDPVPLRQQKSGSPAMRALGAKSRSVEEQIGSTRRGGVTVQFKDGGELVPFNKGKWVTSSFAEMLIGRSDRGESLENLKAQGYNVNAQRDFLVVSLKDVKDPIIFGARGASDKKAPKTDDETDGPSRMALRPGLPGFGGAGTDKHDYGLVSICTEVQTIPFGDAMMITVKKPVIYLYPEKKTEVTVKVSVQGEFIAQYPQTKDGTWKMIAMPDGALFDPKTEKRYSYIFWEAANPGLLAIDENKAFCVRGDEAENFLENAAMKFGLNDKERTDFVSYWIPSLSRNAVSLVQFLSADECAAYATMDIQPKPDAEIRLFMIFKAVPKVMKVGNPVLPELRRGKFTVVEWGGANLDE
jgi:hypothetical protein